MGIPSRCVCLAGSRKPLRKHRGCGGILAILEPARTLCPGHAGVTACQLFFLPPTLPSPSFLFSKSFPCHTSENSPVSPVIATLPKTHVSNPFACHTSEPPGSVVPRYRNAPAFHLTQWLSTRRNLCRRV